MPTFDAIGKHATTLDKNGCRTLADVRSLPRGSISRRFDVATLPGRDTSYELRLEAHVRVELPQTFHNQLELIARWTHDLS